MLLLRSYAGLIGRHRLSESHMNFKRKKPKNARAGCLMCKPHKVNGACPRHKDMKMGNLRRYQSGTYQMRCEGIKN